MLLTIFCCFLSVSGLGCDYTKYFKIKWLQAQGEKNSPHSLLINTHAISVVNRLLIKEKNNQIFLLTPPFLNGKIPLPSPN